MRGGSRCNKLLWILLPRLNSRLLRRVPILSPFLGLWVELEVHILAWFPRPLIYKLVLDRVELHRGHGTVCFPVDRTL
jgi:hypothetical protein